MRVIESVQRVVEQAAHVRINRKRLGELAKNFKNEGKHWMQECPVDLSSLSKREKVAFLVVFNAISFSYWGEPKWKVEHERKPLERGTWSMIAALKRANDAGVPILNPKYLASLTRGELAYVLRGIDAVQIPMLEERLRILKEIGTVTCGVYDADFTSVFLRKSNIGTLDALYLLDRLVEDFPSFNDSTEYNGEVVYFYKRAQLLVSDIAQMVGLPISNTEQLTACADYILPMVLRYYGILEYSSTLAQKVDGRIPLVLGGTEESEIRASTIMAVRELSLGLGIAQMQMNDYLWSLGPKIPNPEHHLVEPRSTVY